MEAQSMILGLIIASLCVLFVAWPFIHLSKRETAASEQTLGTDVTVLYEQQTVVYETIRDLDFDYETGKLTEQDYQQQREEWVQRGVDILKAIDTLQQQTGKGYVVTADSDAVPADSEPLDLDAQIEAAVASRRRTA